MSRPFAVVGLDHVTVTAPEELMGDTISWYSDCLGLAQIDKPEGARPDGAWFRAGDQEIHISIDPHNPPRTAHFCVVVNDFATAVEQLRGAGCHIEQAPAIPGRNRCFTRDPAGNQLEVVAIEEPTVEVAYEEVAE